MKDILKTFLHFAAAILGIFAALFLIFQIMVWLQV